MRYKPTTLVVGYWQAHIGKIVSEETKKKMSENHVDYSGQNNPNFGKHCSDETKGKISINL